jgi:two-component sensor histidine kinase
MAADLLGNDVTPTEAELLDLYGRLQALLASDDLAPCTQANVRAALAALRNAVNDLALVHEHLTDLGL